MTTWQRTTVECDICKGQIAGDHSYYSVTVLNRLYVAVEPPQTQDLCSKECLSLYLQQARTIHPAIPDSPL